MPGFGAARRARGMALTPLVLSVLLLGVSQSAEGWQPASAAVIRQYCVGCHNNKVVTANISFDAADLAKVGDHAQLWEKALRKLQTNQMPPAGLPQPTPAARKALVTYLETELDRA